VEFIGLRAFPLALLMAVGAAPQALTGEGGPALFLNPSIREAGEAGRPPANLRFASVDDFAPFTSFGADGLASGVNVDLARELCAQLRISGACTFQILPFSEIEAALAERRIDAALAGIVPSAANRERLLFSHPYARLPARFLERMPQGQAAASSAATGTETGVVSGTVHDAMASALFPEMPLKRFPDDAALRAALKAGSITQAFGDGIALGVWAASPDAGGCCALKAGGYFLPGLKPDALTVAVSSARPDILQGINAALHDIAVSGRLNEIFLRRIPFDPVE
jgi:polar amino acid transport system substrate-binding protein